jgi:hypothetical protein
MGYETRIEKFLVVLILMLVDLGGGSLAWGVDVNQFIIREACM